jgi:hypothetical protein
MVAAAPSLLRAGDGADGDICRCGVTIGDGWVPIVLDALRELQAALPSEQASVQRIDQIKQKYARLEIYFRSEGLVTLEMRLILAEANRKAAMTCEECGAPGRLRTSKTGGLRIGCNAHEVRLFG